MLAAAGGTGKLFRKEFSPVRKRESGADTAPLSLFLLRQGRKKKARDCRAFFKL